MKPVFFPSLADWHAWLEDHHENHQELWVGFHKKDSGKASITWPESVDGALCFGWIDSVRKSLNETSYVIRFTPRRPRSVWSAVNIKRAAALTSMGMMRPAGLQAFERRTGNRSKFMPTNNATAPSSVASTKNSFARIRKPGISSRRSRRGIGGPQAGG
jgi:uncharacterized protein YdeI (YjbR/CyaY-like superfamily)